MPSSESPTHYQMPYLVPSPEDSTMEMSDYYRKSDVPRTSEQGHLGCGNDVRDQYLREHLMGKRFTGHHHHLEDQLIEEHRKVKQVLEEQRQVKQALEEQISARNRWVQECFFDRPGPTSSEMPTDYSMSSHGILREHLLANKPKSHSPPTYLDTKEAYQSVPSLRELYPKLDSDMFTSFYSDNVIPKGLMNYDHRPMGMNLPYLSGYENPFSVPSDYHLDVRKSSLNMQY